MKRGRLIILYSTILQMTTAIFVFLSPNPILIARLGAFYQVFPNYYTGAVLMFFASTLALFGLFSKGNRFYFFSLQFAFLIMTAGSALSLVLQSHYADGVIRPWQFIFLDQLPSFITTLLYTFAIFDFSKENE